LLDYEKYRNTLITDYLHLLNVETFSCKDATWLSSSRPDKNWGFWGDYGGIVKLRELGNVGLRIGGDSMFSNSEIFWGNCWI